MKLVRPPRHKLDPPSTNEISTDNLNAEQFILLEKPDKEQLRQLLPPRCRIYLILAKIVLVLILAISYLTFCFIVHYRTILIGRSGVLGPPFGHCEHTFIIPDCPAFSSSQHRINYHNCGYFDCLCRAVAFERRRKRDQGRFGCLSSVHTALNSRSGLVGWRFFSPYAHPPVAPFLVEGNRRYQDDANSWKNHCNPIGEEERVDTQTMYSGAYQVSRE